jgi:hypothetical protein
MTEQPEPKQKKRKDKVRSAWISFVGRIVAQILGAVVTVTLGLLAVHRVPSQVRLPQPSGRDQSAATCTAGDTRRPVARGAPRQFFFDRQRDVCQRPHRDAHRGLSQIKGLRVISRTSSMQYRGERRSLPAIARDLGVDLIVEGSIVRADERVRVTAQLIDGKRDEHLWASSFHRVLRDELSVQTAVAQAIAAAVSDAIAPRQQLWRVWPKPPDWRVWPEPREWRVWPQPPEWRVWIDALRDRAVGLLRRALGERRPP